jgi:hypothetical protein
MSKIHVLESDGNFGYSIAIHFDTPLGNNSVGLSWKSCALAAGLIGSTSLEVGSEPGNITQAEHDSIIAGDTIEVVATVVPGVSPTSAAVNALADVAIAAYQAMMARRLKYYGHMIG